MGDAWRIEWHEEVDSTNRLAVARVLERWADGESADGVVIAARRQTAGRGQHGRQWVSPEGGLYLSAVMEEVPTSGSDRLALVAGVAVVEGLLRMGAGLPRIRWPNDVLMDGKKVAGILCEGLSQSGKLAVVIGIGINVNTRVAELPAELRRSATSLVEADGKVRRVEEVAQTILACLREELAAFRDRGLSAVLPRVREWDVLREEPARMMHRGAVVEGIGAGISGEGELLLRGADGIVRAYADGSISAAQDS